MSVKKFVSAAMSLCIASTCLAGGATSATAEDIVASGTHGDNITWTLDSEGTLTLTGEGDMPESLSSSGGYGPGTFHIEWKEGYEPPWYDIREKITKIVVGENITSVGSQNFVDCDNLTEVVLPDGLKLIGFGTFLHCDSLTDINLPEGLETVCMQPFGCCISLTDITFPESVTMIEEGALVFTLNLKYVTIKNPDCEIYDDSETISNYRNNGEGIYEGVIYGEIGSTAQAYAEKYGYKFSPIGVGDINSDGSINAIDASLVLSEYSSMAATQTSLLTSSQIALANVNADSSVNAIDASLILGYYTYTATGGEDSFVDYMNR